jgi:hypothetical protein
LDRSLWSAQLAYFNTYGFDDNVVLTIVGMVGMIPAFFLALEIPRLLDHLMKLGGVY